MKSSKIIEVSAEELEKVKNILDAVEINYEIKEKFDIYIEVEKVINNK